MPFALSGMDLDIMLSEVNQRKTNIIWYHLYVEPKKKMIQMNLFAKQKQTHRHKKLLVTEMENSGEGINQELGIHRHKLLIYNKDKQHGPTT